MSWAKVGEKYGLKYRDQNVTSEDGIKFELDVSRGTSPKDSKMNSVGPGLKEHIYENFLQVGICFYKLEFVCFYKLEFDFTSWKFFYKLEFVCFYKLEFVFTN